MTVGSLRLAHGAGMIGILLTLGRVGVNRNSIKIEMQIGHYTSSQSSTRSAWLVPSWFSAAFRRFRTNCGAAWISGWQIGWTRRHRRKD